MTFKSYNVQLTQLTQSILSMGHLVKEMITVTFESLTAKDDAHKEQIRELDKKVNELDRSINDQATTMLAFRSPMGDDLRFVTSAFGIASDLEHAGDLAKNTTKRSLKLGDYHPERIMTPLGRMIDIITTMLSDALHAVDKRDPELAIDVWRRDKQVDDLYHDILKVLQEEMHTHPDAIEALTHLMFANKNLERIADYTTSLARTVYYVTTGKQATKEVLKGKSGQ